MKKTGHAGQYDPERTIFIPINLEKPMNQAKIEKYVDRVVNLSDAQLKVQAESAQTRAKILFWLGVVLAALWALLFAVSWMEDGFREGFRSSTGLLLGVLAQMMVYASNSQHAATLLVILRLRNSTPASATPPSPESIPQT